jgi:hypothetical protein
MHTCRHCGRENPKDATLCVECGLDLGPSAIEQGVSHVRARSGGFFRWRVASIFLILLTVAYGLTAPLNLWFAKLATQRDDLHATAREWFWGAVWNALVAMLRSLEADATSKSRAFRRGCLRGGGGTRHRDAHLDGRAD